MEATQSKNYDVPTHSGPVPSEIETGDCSSWHQNVETGKASPKIEITTLIRSLYEAAVEGKIDDFKQHEKHLDQLVTTNKNTILHIHITARPLDFVEGIYQQSFPQSPLDIMKWAKKLFMSVLAQETAQLKQESSLKFVGEILEMCPGMLWQVNIKDETLLHIAARHGHVDIVELFIRKLKETQHNDQEKGGGAARQMLRMTNIAKDTALHEAVRFKHLHVVERLLKEDPDYSYDANAAGETPFYLALERGYDGIVTTMASFIVTPSDYNGPIGRTALHAAVIRNDLGMTKMILKKGGDLRKVKDEGGWIPLHYAAYYGYVDIVKELLDKDKSTAYIKTGKEENGIGNEEKTDIEADNEKKIALHIAASRGNVDVMEELISRCPDCSELVDERGWNVFHFAVESRNPRAISFVLRHPFLRNLLNEYNDDGNTPLHQLADSDVFLPSFIFYPGLDKLAFNKKNLNALDITSRKKVLSGEQKYVRHLLEAFGLRENLRVKDKDEDNRKGKNNEGNIMAIFKEAKETHLLVATLIATVTFAAGITVPGGYKDDQGTAILLRNEAFKTFVVTNTIAMMLSSSAVIFHVMALGFNKKWFLAQFDYILTATLYAIITMVIAFISGTYAVLAPSGLGIATCVTGCILFLFHRD